MGDGTPGGQEHTPPVSPGYYTGPVASPGAPHSRPADEQNLGHPVGIPHAPWKEDSGVWGGVRSRTGLRPSPAVFTEAGGLSQGPLLGLFQVLSLLLAPKKLFFFSGS